MSDNNYFTEKQLKKWAEEGASEDLEVSIVPSDSELSDKEAESLRQYFDRVRSMRDKGVEDYRKKSNYYPLNEDEYDTPKLPDQEQAEYEGREVTLHDPFRIEDDEKKFAVYVRNPDTGNVNQVKFGSDDMEIKRDQESNLENFRARFSCDDYDQSDKHKATFWSCLFWRKDMSVSDILDENKEERLRGIVRSQVRKELRENGIKPDGISALRSVRTINKFSDMLFRIIDENDEIPQWILKKLAVASEELNDIYQYIENEKMGLK